MDKSNAKVMQNVGDLPSNIERTLSKPGEGLSRTSIQSNKEKPEISVPTKEKAPELNNKPSLRPSYEDFMKLGSLYGPLAPQYIEQLSAGFPPRGIQETEGNPADLASAMHLWQSSEGVPMHHPLYLSAMFPHMALPDGPVQYYPYMYPPAFALGNHHIHPEPPSSNGKSEHPAVEADRKANRTAESETRVSASKKSEGTVKSWKPESETKRKESVIKNIGNTKGIVENGNINSDLSWKRHANGQLNGTKKSSKIDYPREEDKRMQRNTASKFSLSQTEERASRISPPTVTRGAEFTNRAPESSLQSTFVSSSASRSNPKGGMTLDQDMIRHPHSSPYYIYSSPSSGKSYDTIVSRSGTQHVDKRTADLDTRMKDEGMGRDLLKDVTRIKSIRRGEDGRGELRINGVNSARSKTKDSEEHASERDYFRRESRKNRRYLERSSDRRMSDEREERRLKLWRNKRDRLITSTEKKRRQENDGDSGVYASSYREIQENRENSNGQMLAKSSYSVSGPVDLRTNKIPERNQVNMAKSTSAGRRAEDKMDNSWNARLDGPKDLSRVSETADLKKADRFNISGTKTRDNGLRDVPSNSEKFEKDRYDEMRLTEMERLRYRHLRDHNDLSHDRASFFGSRFVNPAMFDHRTFDSRLIGPKISSRCAVESRMFDPHFSESNLPVKALEKRKERILNESADEKRNTNDRKEERNGKEEERIDTNDRFRAEHLRAIRDSDHRSRNTSGASGRSASPRSNEMEKIKTREDREGRSTSEVGNPKRSKRIDGSKVYKSTPRDSSVSPSHPDRSRRRSPVTQRTREQKSNPGDVNRPKSNPSSEATRGSDLRTGTSNGTPVSRTNPPGSGFLMTPAGTGYQSVPIVNTDAHPFLQQILQAQNEGRIPMVLMPQTGMYPPHVADPNNTALFPNEYLTALSCVASELQDPSSVFMYPNLIAAISQRMAQNKAAALAGKEYMRHPQHLTQEEERVQRQGQFAKQQQQQDKKEKQQEPQQREQQEQNEKQQQEKQQQQRIQLLQQLFQQQQLQQLQQQLQQHVQRQQQQRQQQEQQRQQQQRQLQQPPQKQQQPKQQQHPQQQSPQQKQRKELDNKRSSPLQAASLDNVKSKSDDIIRPQSLKNVSPNGPMDLRGRLPVVPERKIKEEINGFHFQNVNAEQRFTEDLPGRINHTPIVNSEAAPSIPEEHSRPTTLEAKGAKGVSDVGELSPKSVSAAEALSRFKSSTFRFMEQQESSEETEMQRSETTPSKYEDALLSPTLRTYENRFSFSKENELGDYDHFTDVPQAAEPVIRCKATGEQTKDARTHGDLSELFRAAMDNQELLPNYDVAGEVNFNLKESHVEVKDSDDEILSDECVSEPSSCSDLDDRDEGFSLFVRSPCVPSSRRLPRYLEDKENLFAQNRRSEKHRQNICENINRLRKEAKRGLTKATKERYASLASNKLTLDAESVLNTACSNIKAATEIGDSQVDLRDQLVTIQKTYREKSKELVRLAHKHKDRNDPDCGKSSPVKRGPGRPRKRKNCANQKANANNEDPISGGNSPCEERPESPILSTESALSTHQDSETDDMTEVSKGEVTSPVPPANKEEGNVSRTMVAMSESPSGTPSVRSPIQNTNLEEKECSKPSPDQPVNDVAWVVVDQSYTADEHPDDPEIIPKKKLKKKRRRITSDSDPELTSVQENSDKPKKPKKNKKKSKVKNIEQNMEIKKVLAEEQVENDDEVFASGNDNLDQGLELLAKYSEDPDVVRPLNDKIKSKKRKPALFVHDGSALKPRTPKKASFKLDVNSPPKDVESSFPVEPTTNEVTHSPKTPDEERKDIEDETLREKVLGEYPMNCEKPSEKMVKTKGSAVSLPGNNEEFYPRRSERIFLSSSSSLTSPTSFGSFDMPVVNKKKAKSLGKLKKKDQDGASMEQENFTAALHDFTDEKLIEKEISKKKRKMKGKNDEKKKKKLKPKRKGSLGDLSDEEYDEESFVEEIKQLPKRNRQAPRRYLEYDSGEEKLDDEVSVKDQEFEDGCDSESEKTEINCQDSNVTEQVEEDAQAAGKQISDHLDVAHEQRLGIGLEENSSEDVDLGEVKTDEMEVEKEEDNEDGLDEKNETDKEDEKTEEQSTKEKAPFEWMFTLDELCEGRKMLLPVDGVYYPSRIDAIHVPDLYAIVLDGERGRRPHFRSSEQLLTEAVKDIQPLSLSEIPLGTRVCAYWSQQYRCFYPGVVSEVPEDEKIGRNCCWVEFDDGDSGEFPLQDVRRIPPDFSQEECESNSGLPEPKTKKSELSDKRKETRDEGADDELVSDSGDSMVENGQTNNKNRKVVREQKRERWKDANSEKRDKREQSNYSKTIGRRAHDEYYRSKTTKYRTFSGESESSKTVRTERNNAKRKLKLDLQKSCYHNTHEDGISRDDDGEIEWNSDVFSDESPLTKKRFTKYSSDNISGNEDLAEAFPADRIWQWSGKPCPNKRKGKGRKVFYKSIFRGEEKISVGDCAVFLSSPSKNPDLPYVGKIIKMWERFNGNKRVRVKWYYHPEETIAGRRPSDGKNGLYLSSHVDENDVQTIAHKCEVVLVCDSKNKNKSESDSSSDVSNNNTFWRIGTYDPMTETFPSDTE